MSTIAELLLERERLIGVSDSAALDIELLLCHCLQKPRSYLRAWSDHVIENDVEQEFMLLLERRIQGEPIAYITGKRGFWTLDLAVSPATLIPRPDTELLVEKVLDYGEQLEQAMVLDLGTGTGAIALALASEKPEWRVLGCDRQVEAVNLAESNRQQLAINNVRFIESNWFSQIPAQRFDLIVSNPPYIDPDDQHLQQGDVRFEPHSALVSDNKGLADIEAIIATAPDYLIAAGELLLEHGYDQGEAVRTLMEAGGFTQVQTFKDLAGHDRVTAGRVSSGK
jgi:release factor glutamine methyltransferase